MSRIIGWPSTWGIRQSQFFETAPVAIWRELHRLRDAVDSKSIEAARVAADCGDWAGYSSLAPDICCLTETGSPPELDGVPTTRRFAVADYDGVFVVTHPHRWIVCAASESSTPWSSGNNCTASRELKSHSRGPTKKISSFGIARNRDSNDAPPQTGAFRPLR